MFFYLLAWRRYVDFSGHASREEFWMFMLVHLLITLGCIALDMSMHGMGWFDVIYNVASAMPMIAIIVRRLHDIGRSGWWGWIFFLPIVGPFALVYLLVQPACSSIPSVGVAL